MRRPKPLSRSSHRVSGRSLRYFGYVTIAIAATAISIYRWQRTFESYSAVQYDDSYITYRYAANMANGNGLRFNPGGDENSSSSLLYTLLLAVLRIVTRLDLPILGLAIGLVSLVLATLLIFAIVTENSEAPSVLVLAGLAAMTFVTNGIVGYWAVSGMDTLFFVVVLLASLWTSLKVISTQTTRRTFGYFCACVVALILCRPEGILVATVLVALVSVFAYKTKWAFLSSASVATLILLYMGSIAALFAFYGAYYGSLIPDPVRFKNVSDYYSLTAAEQWQQFRKFQLTRVSLTSQLVLAVAFVGSLLLIFSSRTSVVLRAFLTILLSVGAALLVVLSVSAYSDEYRYYVPLIAIACILIGFIGFQPGLSGLTSPRMRNLVFGVAVAIGLLILSGNQRTAIIVALENSRFLYLQAARIEMGQWLETNTEADSLALAGDLGALSFYNLSNRYVDSAGLVNRSLMDSLIHHGRYRSTIISQLPDLVVDTDYPNAGLASEIIFNSPSDYYEGVTLIDTDACDFRCVYGLTLLRTLPEQESLLPRISSYALSRYPITRLDK